MKLEPNNTIALMATNGPKFALHLLILHGLHPTLIRVLFHTVFLRRIAILLKKWIGWTNYQHSAVWIGRAIGIGECILRMNKTRSFRDPERTNRTIQWICVEITWKTMVIENGKPKNQPRLLITICTTIC